jgi:cytochrome c biogenesis protein CcdA
MTSALIVLASALWLGILTSISPCPLATNIAAISYLSKKIIHVKAVLWSGVAYTLGRMFAYAILGLVIINSLLSVPVVAQFLQKYMNKALGPILILTGLFLLDAIKINIPRFGISQQRQDSLAQAGIKGAFVLGILFALSFCPISAALFFGSLIPLSLQSKFGIILPFIYGLGTGLPVLFFSIFIAIGARSLYKWFHWLGKIEHYTRKVTGITFILVGIYFAWTHMIINFFQKVR